MPNLRDQLEMMSASQVGRILMKFPQEVVCMRCNAFTNTDKAVREDDGFLLCETCATPPDNVLPFPSR